MIELIRKLYRRAPTANLVALILLLGMCLCTPALGQKEFGFSMPKGMKRVEIEFEEYNNLIVIPVTISRFLTIKFILDTGVETAILTEKLFADLIDANYVREFTIAGPGIVDSVEVLVANDITFYLPGGLIGKNMSMLVLKKDYLQMAENMGEEVYGIMGYDIFSRFTVEINYDKNKLILHDPERFKPKKKCVGFPIEIKKNKPFLKTSITQGDKKSALGIMIDTGASHAALLDIGNIAAHELPDEKIVTKLGRGIAGEIPGYLSRLERLSIGEFSFDNVLFSAPFEGAYNKVIKRGSKHGTIGGEILHRFNVTIDYRNRKIYLRKASRYNDAFEHDMSGMTINAKGEDLDRLEIVDIKQGSPADWAGLKVGDTVTKINLMNLDNARLSEIYSILRKREGLKINCRVLRDGEKIKASFRLKRMI